MIDQVVGAYRLVRIDAPGALPAVVATWPYEERAPAAAPPIGFAGISSDDRTVVLQRWYVDEWSSRLLRIDTATGVVEEIAKPQGGFAPSAAFGLSFAGWASVGDP